MPINTIALISGGLSFSAALAWNKAINTSINKAIGGNDTDNTVIQAIITTLVIILTVLIINVAISVYSKFRPIKNSTIEHGNSNNPKVKLWLNNN